MPHVALAHRIAEAVWRQHFRIPEPAYWAGLLVSAVGFSVEATLGNVDNQVPDLGLIV
jgi:hypothetical protein